MVVRKKMDWACGAEPLPVYECDITPTNLDQREKERVEGCFRLVVAVLARMEWQVS